MRLVNSRDERLLQKKRESMERILLAASGLFIERGAHSVSMEEVAEASGVARRTLFNYFASKDELLYAVASPMLEEALRLTDAALAEAPLGLDSVIGLCLGLWKRWGRRLSLLYSVDLGESARLSNLHGEFMARFKLLIEKATSSDPRLAGEKRLVGGIVYRCFVPLLLAIDDMQGPASAERFTERFSEGLRGLINGVV